MAATKKEIVVGVRPKKSEYKKQINRVMTEQQYNRVCQIKDRLSELADVKKQIEGTLTHRLYFAYKECGGDFRCCPDWAMSDISEILDKHDVMIRQEIEEEIERLKKEIEEL